MKRGIAPGGMNPNPTLFPMPQGPRDCANKSDCGDPEQEALPESFQNMMAAMNVGPVPQQAHSASMPLCATEKHGHPFPGGVEREAPTKAPQCSGQFSRRNGSEQGAVRLQR
jgi:hypothetical protein